jgi:hypothetical protein
VLVLGQPQEPNLQKIPGASHVDYVRVARDPTAIRGRREEHFLIGPMAAIFHQLRSSSQPL